MVSGLQCQGSCNATAACDCMQALTAVVRDRTLLCFVKHWSSAAWDGDSQTWCCDGTICMVSGQLYCSRCLVTSMSALTAIVRELTVLCQAMHPSSAWWVRKRHTVDSTRCMVSGQLYPLPLHQMRQPAGTAAAQKRRHCKVFDINAPRMWHSS